MTEIVGGRVRDLRRARGWSQLELSCLTGVTQSTISKLETGRLSRVHLNTLQRLAVAFDVDPGVLAPPTGTVALEGSAAS